MSTLKRCLALLNALQMLLRHQLRAERWIRFRSAQLWGEGLSAGQRSRCRHYFRGALFLGTIFAAQRGQALRTREIRQFAYLAALAALFDDSAEGNLDSAYPPRPTLVNTIKANHAPAFPTPVPPALLAFALQTKATETLLAFWQKICVDLPSEAGTLFEKNLLRVFEIETDGSWLYELPVPIQTLQKRAEEKGGRSALLFRLLMWPLPSPAECRVARALGALVQASDDLFDLWHDAQRQIPTPARYWAEAGHLYLAKHYFEQQWRCFAHALQAAPAASGLGRQTALALAGMLATLTHFCLQHYSRLAQKHGTLPWHQRKTMVLDMAHWGTRLRAVAFAVKNGFLPM